MYYFDESLKFIESDEMRNYLRERGEQPFSCYSTRHICTKIVSYAPASLDKKIPVLELIAEQTESDHINNKLNPAKIAVQARIALDERYNNMPGTVFQLRIWKYHKIINCYYTELFTDFDVVIRQINKHEEGFNDPNRSNYISYTIYKHVPGNDGEMDEYCCWRLNSTGEIWYFGYTNKFKPDDWDDIYSCLGDLNLPVPFEPGDIVTADCRPFRKKKHVVITDIGDNEDCCAVQCLYVTASGDIKTGAYKHSHFHKHPGSPCISPLYRTTRYNGELDKNDSPLAAISDVIKSSYNLFKPSNKYINNNTS